MATELSIPEPRRFDSASINAAVDKALATLPAGQTFDHAAVIVHGDVHGNVRVAAIVRLGDDWSFMGYLEKDWKRPVEGGVQVAWSI